MSRFRKQLLFLCDALLFAVAVAGYKFITVLLPYTEVGAKGSFPKNVLLLYGCTVIAQLLSRPMTVCGATPRAGSIWC